jgi:multidrug transporter EmrE-like cation transporter
LGSLFFAWLLAALLNKRPKGFIRTIQVITYSLVSTCAIFILYGACILNFKHPSGEVSIFIHYATLAGIGMTIVCILLLWLIHQHDSKRSRH